MSPDCHEAWHELGECYWKLADWNEARTCFETAIKYVCCYFIKIIKLELLKKQTPCSLRSLSTVIRQQVKKQQTEADKLQNMRQSIKLAHDAVQLDQDDAESWC
jgi:hypothetical protein